MTALTTLTQDLRYALRQLRRAPGFTLTAVLTLALGIGANTAMFTIIENTLLKPLPYPQQQELVGLDFERPSPPANEQTGESADFLQHHATSFSSVGIADDGPLNQNFSADGGAPQTVTSLRVSAGYLPTLGIAPLLGRTFSTADDLPGAAPTAVLTESLWRNALAADPHVIGRTIHLNADSYTVIGIMPASLRTQDSPEVWQPLHLSPADPGYIGDNYQMIARLRPGTTLQQASAEMSILNAALLLHAFPHFSSWGPPGAPKVRLALFPFQQVTASFVKPSVLALSAAVAAVLLMVCLNLAGLLIARSAARRHELAVRMALGAGRAALLRLLLVETLLLAVAGSTLGLLLAAALVPWLLHSTPIALPSLQTYTVDTPTVAAAFALGLLAMLLFGLLPSWRTLRGVFAVTTGSRIANDGLATQRMGKLLLVSQVALTTMLLSVGALLLGTFLNMRSLPIGVAVHDLYAAQVNLRGNTLKTSATTNSFIAAVLDRLHSNPAITAAAAVNGLPLDRGLNSSGNPTSHPEQAHIMEGRYISPGYFHAVGTQLLTGQDVSISDTKQAAPVALINFAAAKKWFGDKPAVGEFATFSNGKPLRIIGVVADARGTGIANAVDPTIYIPFTQIDDETAAMINGWFPTTFVLRAAPNYPNSPETLLKAATDAVRATNPEVPLGGFYPMQHFVDKGVAAPRFFSILAMAFAAFAVLLTLIGTFGLLSFQVTARTREFGIRMALGSDRAGVLLLVLRRGLTLTLIGLAVGIAGSTLLRQGVRAFFVSSLHLQQNSLAGVLANPNLMVAAAVTTILLATLAASLLPAHRAANTNPNTALRAE